MMYGFLSFFALRTILIFVSTAFAIASIMLALNMITVDDLINILGIDPNSSQALALKQVISRFQEVTTNILTIISKLLNQVFSWAGVDVNLQDIKVDIHPVAPVPHNHIPADALAVPQGSNLVNSVNGVPVVSPR